ncbi:MAG: hypothetical protein ABIH26_00375 [Candidatus Eisenbacteria bacterium]
MLQILASTFLALLLGTLFGCAGGPNQAILDITAATDRLSSEDAYKKITAILIDNNFDIKQGDKDLGLITTEYRQFASVDGSPPFDYYLQIRTTIKTRQDGKLVVKMAPSVKEVNRLNVGAFTERQLWYFDADAAGKAKWDTKAQARLKGHTMFMNVVQDVADACGLGVEELDQNLQTM